MSPKRMKDNSDKPENKRQRKERKNLEKHGYGTWGRQRMQGSAPQEKRTWWPWKR